MKTDWEVKTLGEVCQFINGRAYKKTELLSEGKYPVLRVGNFFTNDHWYYSDLELDKDKYCDDGDLLYAWSASFGPRIWKGGKVIYHYHIWKLIPNRKLISKEFLFRLLYWDVDKIKEDQGKGTTMTHVGKGSIESRLVFLPPLPEQQRIVAILDEAFAAIDKAKENAQKNLQNARALFESYLQSVFANPGEGWEEKTLGTEIDLLCGFAFKSNRYTESPDDIRLLRGDNIMQGILRWEDVKRWPFKESDEYNRYQLREDDIVLAMDRPWVKAGLKYSSISKEDLPSLLVQRTARLRVGSNLDKRFLSHLLGSSEFTRHIIGVQSGIGVPHISAQQIKDFKFFKPTLARQQTIVVKLDALSAETKKLEAIYQQKLIDLDELKKSILQKAFQGELTAVKANALAI